MNRESPLVCLLPTGSAHEEVKGISHLFEHMLIGCLYRLHPTAIVKGRTSEDYVILFCSGLNPDHILETIREPGFQEADLDFHKARLSREIGRESAKQEESFFRFVWQETPYEKSPLGAAAEVAAITLARLHDLKQELLEKRFFFYSKNGLQKTKANGSCSLVPPAFKPAWRKDNTYPGNNKSYHICYFESHSEALHLLTRILKDLNPQKHIQLSEKRQMSALVLETGSRLPGPRTIGPLREKARAELEQDIASIKARFNDRALNELESFYFYDRYWQERVKRMFSTTDRKLLTLAGKLDFGAKNSKTANIITPRGLDTGQRGRLKMRQSSERNKLK